jgi:hypothetical protein
MHTESGSEPSRTGLFHHYVIDNKWFSTLRLQPLTALCTCSCARQLGRSIFMTSTAHRTAPSGTRFILLQLRKAELLSPIRTDIRALRTLAKWPPKTKHGNWSLQLLFGRPETLRTSWFVFQRVLRSVSQSVLHDDGLVFISTVNIRKLFFYVSTVVARSSGLHGRKVVQIFRKSRPSTGNSVVWITYKKSCLRVKIELLKAEILLLLTVNNNNNNNKL